MEIILIILILHFSTIFNLIIVRKKLTIIPKIKTQMMLHSSAILITIGYCTLYGNIGGIIFSISIIIISSFLLNEKNIFNKYINYPNFLPGAYIITLSIEVILNINKFG